MGFHLKLGGFISHVFLAFFFFFLSIEKMVSLLAGCLQGTIYSNGKRLHLELNSAQHWPIHPTGMRSVKWESHFSFGLRLLSCCCSLCFVVCYRDSLIRTAVYESFFFSCPSSAVKAIICLPCCYETKYLTEEGQMQSRDLPYGMTSLWWGNSSKSLPYLAALWFFTTPPPLAIWGSF